MQLGKTKCQIKWHDVDVLTIPELDFETALERAKVAQVSDLQFRVATARDLLVFKRVVREFREQDAADIAWLKEYVKNEPKTNALH